jgi:hypothetical protein
MASSPLDNAGGFLFKHAHPWPFSSRSMARAASGYPVRQSIVIVFVRHRTARAQLPNLSQTLLQALKLQTNLRLHGVL